MKQGVHFFFNSLALARFTAVGVGFRSVRGWKNLSWCEGVVPKLIAIRCPKSNPTQPMDPARPLSVKSTKLCQMNNAHVATKQEVPHTPLRYKTALKQSLTLIEVRVDLGWFGIGTSLPYNLPAFLVRSLVLVRELGLRKIFPQTGQCWLKILVDKVQTYNEGMAARES